jgi:hypothetical protein
MNARDFLRTLFADCTGLLEIRQIPKDGEVSQQFRPLGAGLDWVDKWQPEGRVDTYFGVYPRTRSAGTADAVAPQVSWLFADLDGSEVSLPQALSPTIVVESGTPGHRHCYWQLAQPTDLARVEALNKALARMVGGDLNATDRARVLRLPGTINSKTGREAAVAHYDASAVYEPQDFASLPASEAAVAPDGTREDATAAGHPGATGAASSATVTEFHQGERNAALTSLAGVMRRKSMSEEAIRAALLVENTRRCMPPLPEHEVTGIAHSIARYAPGPAVPPPARDEGMHLPAGTSWPDPPAAPAFSGLAGEFVATVGPHTEADPAALLLSFLVAFGSVVGRGPHFVVEAAEHYTNLNAVMVGPTSHGRKGTAWRQVRRPFAVLDPAWASEGVKDGLSSGEGLIWAVRDPIEKQVPVRQQGRVCGYEQVVEDAGVTDKRLLMVEQEFASTLRVMERDGNTLSPTIRQAWDNGDLRVLTKNSPAKATGAHISIIGHVTRDEINRYLNRTEAGNGFANRFLWCCARRFVLLPEGGSVPEQALERVILDLRTAVGFARGVGEVKRDEAARRLWYQVYPVLSREVPGLLGAVTARAEAQVMRLSCIHALLDRSPLIRMHHLEAALAVWRYCEDSARFIFGDTLGDPVADALLQALRRAEEGLTRTEISKLLKHNLPSSEISRALACLAELGLAVCLLEAPASGRPAERWCAVGPGEPTGAASTKETNETN